MADRPVSQKAIRRFLWTTTKTVRVKGFIPTFFVFDLIDSERRFQGWKTTKTTQPRYITDRHYFASTLPSLPSQNIQQHFQQTKICLRHEATHTNCADYDFGSAIHDTPLEDTPFAQAHRAKIMDSTMTFPWTFESLQSMRQTIRRVLQDNQSQARTSKFDPLQRRMVDGYFWGCIHAPPRLTVREKGDLLISNHLSHLLSYSGGDLHPTIMLSTIMAAFEDLKDLESIISAHDSLRVCPTQSSVEYTRRLGIIRPIDHQHYHTTGFGPYKSCDQQSQPGLIQATQVPILRRSRLGDCTINQ